jgi:hypothetical protein
MLILMQLVLIVRTCNASQHSHNAQVFEIEDEMFANGSALDMSEDGPIRIDVQQPSRRSSTNTQHTRPATSPMQSSPPNGSHPHPIPRPRLNSTLIRAADNLSSITSPLAQIFQPLIVDDDLIEEEEEGDEHGGASSHPDSRPSISSTPPRHTHLISYGPSNRRRLSSINRRATNDVLAARRFPLMNEPVSESPRSVNSIASAAARSQAIPTAEKVLENEENNAESSITIGPKLAAMEERQERMEMLLQKLVDGLANASTSPQ